VLRVDATGIEVACGIGAQSGVLHLVRVQPAGGRAMTASAFAAGRHLAPGARFG
jgi:methionyl-tRNA formyltransferase